MLISRARYVSDRLFFARRSTMNTNQSHRSPDLTYLVLGLIVLAAICYITVTVRQAKVAARESSCTGHIYKITQAINDYRRANGHLPGAIAQVGGGPAHSWRVLILPQLGYEDLYRQYDFDQPWDSPKNQKVTRQMPSEFSCPNCSSENCTSYFMLRENDRSVLVLESNHQSIHWTEPRDVDEQRLLSDPCDPNGFGFGLSDGTIGRGNALPKKPLNATHVGGHPRWKPSAYCALRL